MLDNLKRIADAEKQMTIRVPLIRGFNADERSVEAITEFAARELRARDIHFYRTTRWASINTAC